MDKDEMIEEMAKITNYTAFDFTQGAIESATIYTAIAEALYNANYRKVGDDEIVIKKSEYETLKKDKNDYKQRFESSDKRFEQLLRTSVETVEKKHQYWENKCKEIGDVASKETAREILQRICNRQGNCYCFTKSKARIELARIELV